MGRSPASPVRAGRFPPKGEEGSQADVTKPDPAPAAHSNSTAEDVSPAPPGRAPVSMQEHARRDRQWVHWPDEREAGVRSRLRSLFAPTDAGDAVAELIAVHGRELEERSAELLTAAGALELRERRAQELHTKVESILREGSAELDIRQTELETRARELDVREEALIASEQRVEDRRRELGAVELRAAAVQRREEALRSREAELELRAGELADLARRLDAYGATLVGFGRPAARDDAHLVFTAGETYRLLEREGPVPSPGAEILLDDGPYRCVRVTSSPFPADQRRCALLERVGECVPPVVSDFSRTPALRLPERMSG